MLLTIRHREGDERHLPNRDREDRLSSRLVLVSLSGAAFEETAAMTPGAARARLPRAGPPIPPMKTRPRLRRVVLGFLAHGNGA